jgi:hypothetical protein
MAIATNGGGKIAFAYTKPGLLTDKNYYMRKIYKTRHSQLLLIMAMMLIASSCKTERVLPQKEALKDIAGNWQVIKATRNGTDLTGIVDFSQFRLNFANGNYTMENKLPFLVNQNGSFSLDDPQYPFKITFTPTGAQPVFNLVYISYFKRKKAAEPNFLAPAAPIIVMYMCYNRLINI